ncbi:MAG: hypothetical protein JNM41_14710 [Flavipsychrobacter sp.]|nr:hypothetical protein [Flavipsychrobacter sp.]
MKLLTSGKNHHSTHHNLAIPYAETHHIRGRENSNTIVGTIKKAARITGRLSNHSQLKINSDKTV